MPFSSKRFISHKFLILEIWFIAILLENIQVLGTTDFMRKNRINVLSKQVLSKWMNFQNIFFLLEMQRHHVTDINIMLLMFISYC